MTKEQATALAQQYNEIMSMILERDPKAEKFVYCVVETLNAGWGVVITRPRRRV